MKYKILKSCIGCRQCYRICPVQAIITGPMRIDSEKCIGCGKCYNSCPSKKIIKEESAPLLSNDATSVSGAREGFQIREAGRK